MSIKIRVYSGVTIEDKCRGQLHPLSEVKKAIEIIDLNKSIDCYSNSPDFVSAIKYYGINKGIDTEFFIDGVSHGSNIDPIFKSFNMSFELLKTIISE